MKQYLDLVRHVLANGTRKENRTGIDSISTFGYYYEHDLREGFPLLTTKKMPWRSIVVELLWFLSGSNKAEFLDRHGVTFWKPWYNKDGTVNAAYGPAWRRFEYPSYYESDSGLSCDDGPCTRYNDQIKWVVGQLKEKPMRRDLVVSAWQPHIAQIPPTAKTYWAPCHCMFILNVQNESGRKMVTARVIRKSTQEVLDDFKTMVLITDEEESMYDLPIGSHIKKYGHDDIELVWGEHEPLPPAKRLCLHLTQRSCDTILGVPFNLASYALLTHLLARFADLDPGIFGHTLVDAHIYTAKPDGSKAEFDHIPGAREQLTREPYRLPKLIIADDIRGLDDVEKLLHPSVTTDEIMSKFRLEGYTSHPKMDFKVAV